MTHPFRRQIDDALCADRGLDLDPPPGVRETSPARLASAFEVSELAVASVRAAALELGALLGARQIALDCRLALMWFGMTLRPVGWTLPSMWDPVAGDYRAGDGWIRLHTNAPHHRDAALSVLGSRAEREPVAAALADWAKTDLETAIVAAGGAAAAMHDLAAWDGHPQGIAVEAEPLIAWRETEGTGRAVSLQGLRVLDLTRVLAGPVATRFLAGFGAAVLRIDPPDWNEPGVEPEVTLGKRRAGLDLRQSGDRETFEALLRRADVLVHGYRPGALEGLGYGAAVRRALAPGMIEVSLNAYGHTGPWAGRRGFDSLVQMSTGIAAEGMRRAGSARPLPLPVQALDHATGYLMAAAVLRALRVRARSGRVLSARLSLARTAALLRSGAIALREADIAAETETDLAAGIENTGWGPARRIAFPVAVDGAGPSWPHSSGPLRQHPPRWQA